MDPSIKNSKILHNKKMRFFCPIFWVVALSCVVDFSPAMKGMNESCRVRRGAVKCKYCTEKIPKFIFDENHGEVRTTHAKHITENQERQNIVPQYIHCI